MFFLPLFRRACLRTNVTPAAHLVVYTVYAVPITYFHLSCGMMLGLTCNTFATDYNDPFI